MNTRAKAYIIEACHATRLAGGGIAILAWWHLAEDLRLGRLVRIDIAEALEPFPMTGG